MIGSESSSANNRSSAFKKLKEGGRKRGQMQRRPRDEGSPLDSGGGGDGVGGVDHARRGKTASPANACAAVLQKNRRDERSEE